ncbi:MAG: hydrogenase maturation nickel metallochaperone HypA [Candidatus Eisenbacteria bacterium]|nr:hydrogenase maturation nickel metallochaperone HypA [Candidatus Eisenbacteria bacterium]
MHELSIATEVYETCRVRLRAHEPGRLDTVRLAVGERSAVEPDLLRYAWQAVTSGGPDDGSQLEIEWRPAHQVCAGCGEIPERATGTWLRLCPRCGHALHIEGGDELDILHFTFTPLAGRETSLP